MLISHCQMVVQPELKDGYCGCTILLRKYDEIVRSTSFLKISVTKWLDYWFNVWLFRTIEMPNSIKCFQSRFKIMPNTAWISPRKFAKDYIFKPNLVTLLQSEFQFSKLHSFIYFWNCKLQITEAHSFARAEVRQ